MSLITQGSSSPRVLCAAFSQIYLGGVTQSQAWHPAGSPREQLWVLALSEPSGQSSIRPYLGAHLHPQASRWHWHAGYLPQGSGQRLYFRLPR